jgi:hypothetical protein
MLLSFVPCDGEWKPKKPCQRVLVGCEDTLAVLYLEYRPTRCLGLRRTVAPTGIIREDIFPPSRPWKTSHAHCGAEHAEPSIPKNPTPGVTKLTAKCDTGYRLG